MATFKNFRQGPAQEVLARIGFDLSRCLGWQDFRSEFVEQNRSIRDKYPDNCLIDRAQSLGAVLSTGERAVLHAALAAADFAHVADDLWSWGKVDLLDQPHREAVAATILREDEV